MTTERDMVWSSIAPEAAIEMEYDAERRGQLLDRLFGEEEGLNLEEVRELEWHIQQDLERLKQQGESSESSLLRLRDFLWVLEEMEEKLEAMGGPFEFRVQFPEEENAEEEPRLASR